MCGICGIVERGMPQEERLALVDKMVRAQAHRGPDGSGRWADERAALGHNRLKIIDLSEGAKQPMARGKWVIVYNGEIYNYLELREELKRDHRQRFITAGDTEVILAAWETWGEEALSRMRGMWAFALYNRESGALYLCRDRFGIKPLYYRHGNGRLLFSSEIKAMLETGLVSARANLGAVADFLVGFHDHGEETFFEGVSQVPPACCLCFDPENGAPVPNRYYDLEASLSGRTAAVEDYGEVFFEAIRLHLRSDVPVGTCLSGGLDSSAVATAAAEQVRESYGRPFLAVTARSEDGAKDEAVYARQVAEQGGLEWHTVQPGAADFREGWRRCLYHQEEPVFGPSVFLQYAVMQAAAARGLKVMLDGQGGDETLLGYERYYPVFFRELLRRGRPARALAAFFEAAQSSKLNRRQLAMYSLYFLQPRVRLRVQRGRWRGLPPRLLKGALETVAESARSFGSLRSLQVAEITRFQLPHLLKYEDRSSMAWSVEARVPLLDHRLVETALALEPEAKINEGYTKWALRRIMAGRLPGAVAWRKNKIGFEAPLERWSDTLQGEIEAAVKCSPLVRELGLRETESINRKDYFLLYSLACWEEIFRVSLG